MTETLHTLYWIHLKDHKDITSQGYIGVTKQTLKSRLRGHWDAYLRWKRNGKLPSGIIKNAIEKYGMDNLIITPLCQGTEEEIYGWEKKLRPSLRIGWNTTIGGDIPSGRGSKYSTPLLLECFKMYYEDLSDYKTISDKLGIAYNYLHYLLHGKKNKTVFDLYFSEGKKERPTITNPRAKYTDELIYQVLKYYYEDNLPVRKIKELTFIGESYIRGVCQGQKRKHLYNSFIKKRPNLFRKIVTDKEELKPIFRDLVLKGLSIKEISLELGIGKTTVSRWKKELNDNSTNNTENA